MRRRRSKMAHEIGTDEYLKYLQSETPGELETTYTENVERYIKESQKANINQKTNHFSMSFDNPLKGFPYNEQFGFDKNLVEIEEHLEDVVCDTLHEECTHCIGETVERRCFQINPHFSIKNTNRKANCSRLH